MNWRGIPEQLDPFREWGRQKLPGNHEFAALDLDCVYRRWTKSDPIGKVMLVEKKTHGVRSMTTAQRMTFGLLDGLLSHSDRYHGFYLIAFSGECFDDSEHVWLNNHRITEEMAIRHFSFEKLEVPRYEFGRKVAA